MMTNWLLRFCWLACLIFPCGLLLAVDIRPEVRDMGLQSIPDSLGGGTAHLLVATYDLVFDSVLSCNVLPRVTGEGVTLVAAAGDYGKVSAGRDKTMKLWVSKDASVTPQVVLKVRPVEFGVPSVSSDTLVAESPLTSTLPQVAVERVASSPLPSQEGPPPEPPREERPHVQTEAPPASPEQPDAPPVANPPPAEASPPPVSSPTTPPAPAEPVTESPRQQEVVTATQEDGQKGSRESDVPPGISPIEPSPPSAPQSVAVQETVQSPPATTRQEVSSTAAATPAGIETSPPPSPPEASPPSLESQVPSVSASGSRAQDEVSQSAPAVEATPSQAISPSETTSPMQPAQETALLAIAQEPIRAESLPELVSSASTPLDFTSDMIWVEGRELEWASLSQPRKAGKKENVRRRCRGFHIDRTEVTNRQFAAFLSASPDHLRFFDRRMDIVALESNRFHAVSGMENYPVAFVDWLAAYSFAVWAGKSLPTEDEWMLAALGSRTLSATTIMYPWGTGPPDSLKANSLCFSGLPGLKPVGSYPAGDTPARITDLAGNAAEWTLTEYGTSRDKVVPKEWIVVKGGSFLDSPMQQTITTRALRCRDERLSSVGFRCVIREKP